MIIPISLLKGSNTHKRPKKIRTFIPIATTKPRIISNSDKNLSQNLNEKQKQSIPHELIKKEYSRKTAQVHHRLYQLKRPHHHSPSQVLPTHHPSTQKGARPVGDLARRRYRKKPTPGPGTEPPKPELPWPKHYQSPPIPVNPQETTMRRTRGEGGEKGGIFQV